MELEEKEKIDYDRIAAAIDYINAHFKEQPKMEQIASAIHLSPTHFNRLFSHWAGTSPKRFLQFISINHAKSLLKKPGTSLFDASEATGLSSTSRLHDLFIQIEGMTPAEYKNGGANLMIEYSFAGTPFGQVIVACTTKGICYMAFTTTQDKKQAITALNSKFPRATFNEKINPMHQTALSIFQTDWTRLPRVKLHLRGTEFQLKVWECLLKIPLGQLSTYGQIAGELANPQASRAVGTAIGSNPVAFLIPCHRVIQASGKIGGYMWGPTRKTAMIGWESAHIENSL